MRPPQARCLPAEPQQKRRLQCFDNQCTCTHQPLHQIASRLSHPPYVSTHLHPTNPITMHLGLPLPMASQSHLYLSSFISSYHVDDRPLHVTEKTPSFFSVKTWFSHKTRGKMSLHIHKLFSVGLFQTAFIGGLTIDVYPSPNAYL